MNNADGAQSLKRWKEIVQAFYAKYSGLQAWQQRNIKHVIDHQFEDNGIQKCGMNFIINNKVINKIRIQLTFRTGCIVNEL